MIDRLVIWRQKAWVWILPLVFVALNVGSILFFQATFSGQLDKLENSYDKQGEQLQILKQEVGRVDGFLERVKEQERQSGALYRDYFATEGERFTRVLREIRTLARRAGLDPKAFSYPGTEIDDYDLNRLGIRFSVNGTYDQLRTFINFLELTDQFITLESVTLAGGQGDRDARLSIRFGASTIFAQDDAELLEPPDEILEESVLPEPGVEVPFDAEDDDVVDEGEVVDEEDDPSVRGAQDDEGLPAMESTINQEQDETI